MLLYEGTGLMMDLGEAEGAPVAVQHVTLRLRL
jgi:hypothetical protein